MSTIGIVTVTYNSEPVLPDFFASVLSQEHSDIRLYAVDNSSKDRTLELLNEQRDPRICILQSGGNVGFAEGSNIGIRRALMDGCEFILLLNNDVVFGTALLSGLLASLCKNAADMVSPKILYHEPSDKVWWAGGYFQRLLGYRTVHAGKDKHDSQQITQARPASFAPACCLLLRASVFSQIGLMDPAFFTYYEDTDFMYRAWRRGLLLVYEPNVILYHKVSALTGGSSSPFFIHIITRNRVYFWRKHFGMVSACAGAVTLGFVYLGRLALRRASLKTFRIQIRALLDGFEIYARTMATGRPA